MFTESQEATYRAGLVRFYQSNRAIGAGFYVEGGYVVTCAHVVTQCLGLGKSAKDIAIDTLKGKPIEINFLFVNSEERQIAEVVPELWRMNAEDIAVLQLAEGVSSQVSAIPFKESSYYRSHTYHVFGFPDGNFDGCWTQGVFLGEMGRGWIQMEDTKAQGIAIQPGFSGAPVWDESLGATAGMTVAYDKEREEAKVGYMIPYPRLKPALDAIALFNLLLPAAATLEAHWLNAYRLVRPERYTEDFSTTLEAAVLQIQDMPTQGQFYRAIDQFIAYLALPELGVQVQPRLIQWLQGQGFEDVTPLLEFVRQAKDAKPRVSTPHLLFWVKGELNSDRYSVEAYLAPDREQFDPMKAKRIQAPAEWLEESEDEKVDRTRIEEILRACIGECIEQLPDNSDSLTVHMFLPLSCLTCCNYWSVDSWLVDEQDMFNPAPVPIGLRYVVLMRVAERLDKNICNPQRRNAWVTKWNTLTQGSASPTHKVVVLGDCESPSTLANKLRAPQALGFYLNQAPQKCTPETPGIFPVLIGTGAPIAIWFRKDLPNDWKKYFQEFLNCCLSELPTAIRDCRAQDNQECHEGINHIKQHLGLILDDPNLVPPVTNKRMRSPA